MMAERKPPGVDFESWVDRQIREAKQRGEFDNLAGAGKPLSGLDRDWLSGYMEREGLSLDPALPEPLRLRKEARQLSETVAGLRHESEVREVVADLNRRIAAWLRSGMGPRVSVAPVDVEDVVARWYAETGAENVSGVEPGAAHAPRAVAGEADDTVGTEQDPGAEPAAGETSGRRSWWPRRRRGR